MTEDEALVQLIAELRARHYHFVTVTPSTHARILQRTAPNPLTLRDIFGWNRPFRAEDIEPALLTLVRSSGCLEETGDGFRSLVRAASLHGELFLHSAFPTSEADAVFFGPDTYRFAAFIGAHLSTNPAPNWIVDLGAGSGAGGVIAAKLAPTAHLSLLDVNPAAARLARLNCIAAGVKADVAVATCLPQGCDLIIANPPYMIDSAHRTYRDGGGLLGGEIACRWAHQALQALVPGGILLLYTGVAIVEGEGPLLNGLRSTCSETDAEMQVTEIDPDVFGEDLCGPKYRCVERIAVFGIQITKSML